MAPLALLALALAAAAEPAEVVVSWAHEGLPEGMTLCELKPGDWPLWQTGTVERVEESPAGSPVPASTVRLRPGETLRAALLYTNRTSRTLRFFAAPHHVEPARASLGFKFKCLCTNHVYEVPPGRSWYRVVELRLARGFSGRRLEIKHHLVAVGAGAAADFAESDRRLK